MGDWGAFVVGKSIHGGNTGSNPVGDACSNENMVVRERYNILLRQIEKLR